MNIDLLFPTLTGDLTKLPQADPAGSDGAGQEFEDMLVQQSKAENGRPQKKTEDKKAPEKPEQKSTQEDEAAEEGGELAAALVTSQPVVPIAVFEEAEVRVTEDGTVILEPVAVEGNVEAAAPEAAAETAEVLPEAVRQQEQPAEAQPQEAQEIEAPKEQPKAEAVTAEENTEARETGRPEITVQKARQDSRPQDGETDADIEQESQPVFRDVKAAPVKVGETQRPVDAEKPEAPRQIADHVYNAVQQGQDVVRIQLNPANLGNVTIEITRDAAGNLAIVMTPETAKAAEILTQHSSSLMQALMDKGEFTTSIAIVHPEENENAGMMMNPDGHNGQAQEDDDEKKKKRQNRAEGVSAADFLSQLRLGLIGSAE